MQPKIKNTGSPVRNTLAIYTLVFYTASFSSFLIYYLTHDLVWFETAYAVNIGSIVMALLMGVAEKADDIGHQIKVQEKKDTNSIRQLLNLVAFLLFAFNLVLLKNQWNVAHPEVFAAIWITGNGAACMLISEFRSIAVWFSKRTEEDEVVERNVTEMN